MTKAARWGWIVAAVAAAGVVLVLAFVVLIPVLASQMSEFGGKLPEYLTQLQGLITSFDPQWLEQRFGLDAASVLNEMATNTCHLGVDDVDWTSQLPDLLAARDAGQVAAQIVPGDVFEHLDFGIRPEAGYRRGAGLDPFSVEPLPLDHPFRKLDNVVLTPHLGYVTEEGYSKYYADMVADILGWLDGKPVRVIG